MLAGGGLVFVLTLACRQRLTPGVIVGITAGFALYTVGHMQLYATPALLVSYWWAREGVPLGGGRSVTKAVFALLGWVAAICVVYQMTAVYYGIDFGFKGRWHYLRDWVGLPTFSLAVWMIVAIPKHRTPSKEQLADRA